MRFARLGLRDFGPFKGEHVLDLAPLEGKIVAVCGDNGAGKSTLLELLAGTLYRQCPTRGKLSQLATSRQSYVEVVCEDAGRQYTVKQIVDSLGKGEALVVDGNAMPLVESGKVRAYDEWAAANLTPPGVLYASSFAPQGRRGMLDLSASERKAMLLRMLGCERLEALAADARERARDIAAKVEGLRGRIADVPDHDLDALTVEAVGAGEALAAARERVSNARRVLEQAKAAGEDAGRREDMRAARDAAEQEHSRALELVSDLVRRSDELTALLANADEVRKAAAELPALRAQLDEMVQASTGAQQRLIEGQTGLMLHQREARDLAVQLRHIDEQFVRLRRQRADAEKVADAVDNLPANRAALGDFEQNVVEAGGRVDATAERMVRASDIRAEHLRDTVEHIARNDARDPQTHVTMAAIALDRDDRALRDKAAAPAQLQAGKDELAGAQAHLREQRKRVAELEALAARADEQAQLTVEAEAFEVKLADANERMTAAQLAMAAGAANVETLRGEAVEAKRRADTLAEQVRDLDIAARDAGKVEAAQGQRDEIERQLLQARSDLERAIDRLEHTPKPPADASADLARFEAAVERESYHEAECGKRSAQAQLVVESAAKDVERREVLERELRKLVDDAADWIRLGSDLGRDGLQAMEIDAAVPALNDLANDLLHSCHGARFTVELRTERASADGKRTLEGLDVQVLDTVGGRDAFAETFSGGECVIVGEALALALTVLACQRRGAERPTLVRDESGAALDAENGRAYVAMLRRAAAQVGASCTLLVSHDSGVRELCDARIEIAGGRIEVRA